MDHDGNYKLFFGKAEGMSELLRYLADNGNSWINKLRLETLERVNGSFVSEAGRRRETDILWRVKSAEDWVYLYVLLEFQSREDSFMAIRMMNYISLIYQEIAANAKHGNSVLIEGKLPPVLPIVLYNGESRWKAPTDVKECLYPVQDELAQFSPNARYLLLDLGEMSKCISAKEPIQNFIEVLIKLENITDLEQANDIAMQAIEYLNKKGYDELNERTASWLLQLLHNQRLLKEAVLNEYPAKNLTEVTTMLEERLGIIRDNILAEGHAEGHAKGHAKGHAEGRAEERAKLVCRMNEQGFDNDQISKIFGLDIQEVEEILKTNGPTLH